MALPVTTGLHAHYDADAITGLANNDPVQTWTDLAGISNATQPDAGRRPLYIANGLNGLPVVRFDGTDDVLESAHAGQGQPLTVFIVGNTSDASSATERAIIGLGSQLVFGTPYYGSGSPIRRIYAGSFLDGGTADTAAHLFRFVFNGVSSQIAVDGTVEGSGGSGDRTAQTITLGRDRNTGSRYHQGDIAEAVVYARTLTTQETTDVEDYLTAKWFGSASSGVAGTVAVTEADDTLSAAGTAAQGYTPGRHYSTDGGATWTLFQPF